MCHLSSLYPRNSLSSGSHSPITHSSFQLVHGIPITPVWTCPHPIIVTFYSSAQRFYVKISKHIDPLDWTLFSHRLTDSELPARICSSTRVKYTPCEIYDSLPSLSTTQSSVSLLVPFYPWCFLRKPGLILHIVFPPLFHSSLFYLPTSHPTHLFILCLYFFPRPLSRLPVNSHHPKRCLWPMSLGL